jgi:hypothetical protein
MYLLNAKSFELKSLTHLSFRLEIAYMPQEELMGPESGWTKKELSLSFVELEIDK